MSKLSKHETELVYMAEKAASYSSNPGLKVGAAALGRYVGSYGHLVTGYDELCLGIPKLFDEMANEYRYGLTPHAEINMIINATRRSICLDGGIVAVTEPPCANCMAALINAGIEKMVFPYWQSQPKFPVWESSFRIAKEALLHNPQITYVMYDRNDYSIVEDTL